MADRTTQKLWGAAIIMAVICLFIGSVIGGVFGVVLASRWIPTPARGPSGLQVGQTGTATGAPVQAIHTAVDGTATVNAARAALPAVVTIIAQTSSGLGTGSGFIISQDGYIVTNSHVINGASSISVIYAKGGQAGATLVGQSPEFDLAVVKVEGSVPGVLAWGDSSLLPLGAPVLAIGSVMGEYRNSVTSGILSGFNRQIDKMGGLLQTDAAINQGNSGGPLINLEGQVIGVNTLVVRGDYVTAEGLGFAIPSSTARSVVKNLIENGDARHPFLGIQYQALNPQLASQMSLSITEGAVLETVLDGSPAAAAGLQAGDVIVAMNSRPVDDRNSLVSLLLEHVAGETVTIDVMRNGQVLQMQLTLGERT